MKQNDKSVHRYNIFANNNDIVMAHVSISDFAQ